MAHLNSVITSTTLVGNANLVYSGGSGNWETSISLNSDLTDFFELVLAALEVTLLYKR